MLLAGFALRNIPVINVVSAIDSAWSSALRSMALTIILIKAGLELDANVYAAFVLIVIIYIMNQTTFFIHSIITVALAVW